MLIKAEKQLTLVVYINTNSSINHNKVKVQNLSIAG